MNLTQIKEKLEEIIESAKHCEDANGLYQLLTEDVAEVVKEIDKLSQKDKK